MPNTTPILDHGSPLPRDASAPPDRDRAGAQPPDECSPAVRALLAAYCEGTLDANLVRRLARDDAAAFGGFVSCDLRLAFELHDRSRSELRQAIPPGSRTGFTDRRVLEVVETLGTPDHSDHRHALQDALRTGPGAVLEAVAGVNGLRRAIREHPRRLVEYLLEHDHCSGDRARLWQAFADRAWVPNEWESRYVRCWRRAQHSFLGKAGELIVFAPDAQAVAPSALDPDEIPFAGKILRMRVDPSAVQGPNDLPALAEMRVLASNAGAVGAKKSTERVRGAAFPH